MLKLNYSYKIDGSTFNTCIYLFIFLKKIILENTHSLNLIMNAAAGEPNS